MILAKGAAHIATIAPQGQDLRTRAKMIQGLFFYGINGDGAYKAVAFGIQDAVVISPRAAKTQALRRDLAAHGAEQAGYGEVGVWLEI